MSDKKTSRLLELLLDSWQRVEKALHTNDELIQWYQHRQDEIFVDIRMTDLSRSEFWFHDMHSDMITNKKSAFFSIAGLKGHYINQKNFEQPIFLQKEIGFLGFLCKEINGVLYLLVQAKVEPGNINQVQLSPTIQATKSNFLQAHGGRQPGYLSYFRDAHKYIILADQIQSEQSSRFFGKRNRNMIVLIDEDESIEEGANFHWMTLGQLKRLMRLNNVVNMDTRTVLSCLPFSLLQECFQAEWLSYFSDKAMARSLFPQKAKGLTIPAAFHRINNIKMFDESSLRLCGLSELERWQWKNGAFSCMDPHDFRVVFCDITIDGREVRSWDQPLFEASGRAIFALACRQNNDCAWEFLAHAKPECGCFDRVEFGPTLQLEYRERDGIHQGWDAFLLNKIRGRKNILYDVCLSEEGGRFYHEENENYIIRVTEMESAALPAETEGYFWLTLSELFMLNTVNNVLNIQLRNLLSLLESKPRFEEK